MPTLKERKRKIADWLAETNDEKLLAAIEDLIDTTSKDYYNRYIVLNEHNTLDHIVREGEADIAAKRYVSQEEVKKKFLKE